TPGPGDTQTAIPVTPTENAARQQASTTAPDFTSTPLATSPSAHSRAAPVATAADRTQGLPTPAGSPAAVTPVERTDEVAAPAGSPIAPPVAEVTQPVPSTEPIAAPATVAAPAGEAILRPAAPAT